MLNPHVFRAYDVRGLVGSDITPDVFRLVGSAYGTLIRRNGGRRIAVGQDNRRSSDTLKAGFVEGVLATGLDVVDIGLVPTPILYFATAHWKLDGGATITGSHNPIEYNGVKMVHPGAAPLTEEEIQDLRTMAERGDYESGAGTLESRSPRDDYFETIGRLVRPGRRLRVVVDAGNGVAGLYAPDLLRRIGCDVIELYCESDGSFPNHLPDPEDERNVEDLKVKVVETSAALAPLRVGSSPARDAGAEGALPRRREVPRRRRGDAGAEAALRDHRHRRRARDLPRPRLGARPRIEHESVPHAAVRGPDGRRDRGDEARGLRGPSPLPVRDAAGLTPPGHQTRRAQQVGHLRAIALAPVATRIQEHRVQPARARAADVDRVEIADVDRLRRGDADPAERKLEDPRVRLLEPDLRGVEDEIEVGG